MIGHTGNKYTKKYHLNCAHAHIYTHNTHTFLSHEMFSLLVLRKFRSLYLSTALPKHLTVLDGVD